MGDRNKNWQASCDILKYEKGWNEAGPNQIRERDGKIGQRTNKGREVGRTEFPWQSNPTTSCSVCIYFPHALRKEETKEIWTKWGSNLLAGKREVRCRWTDGATATELYMPLQIGKAGACQRVSHAVLLSETTPLHPTKQASIIAADTIVYRKNVN